MEMRSEKEARFLYDELFVSGGYLKHGIEIADGDVVFDVGANAGLFSASLVQSHRSLRLVLFEPVPETFALLERNAERLLEGAQVTLVQAAVGSSPGKATFEYDPNWAIAASASHVTPELGASARTARRAAGPEAWNRALVADAERLGAISSSAAGRLDAALRSRLLRPLACAAIWTILALDRARRRR